MGFQIRPIVCNFNVIQQDIPEVDCIIIVHSRHSKY